MLKKYTVLVYDIELYQNLFMCTFYDAKIKEYKVFIKFEDKDNGEKIDETYEMFNYLKDINNLLLVSFNGLSYDDNVLKYLERNKEIEIYDLWEWSQDLICKDKEYAKKARKFEKTKNFRYDNSLFKTLDLFEVIRKGQNTKGLKHIGVVLKHDTLQELPIKFNKIIKKDDLDNLKFYNKNDVIITTKVLFECRGDIELREFLEKELKIDCLTLGDTGIAKLIFKNKYVSLLKQTKEYKHLKDWEIYQKIKDLRTHRETIIFKDIIFDDHEFLSESLNNYLLELKEIVLEKNIEGGFDYEKHLEFTNKNYKIALGGIHSEDKPGYFDINNNKILLDLDVASQYPSLIVNKNICPEHLNPDIFISIFSTIVKDRLFYKSEFKKTKDIKYNQLQASLKIVINSVYGLLNSIYHWFYDSKAAYTVTLNNQLYLLNLIERLNLNNIEVISANTDGVLLYFDKDKLDLVREIYKEWENDFNFTLEESFYKKYIRRDVNNYIAIYQDDKIKLKGWFNSDSQLLKSYKFPICPKAVFNYYINGKSIEESIRQETDILEFCLSRKVGEQFEVKLQRVILQEAYQKNGTSYKPPKFKETLLIEDDIQQINRWYCSKPYISGEKRYGNMLKNYEIETGSYKSPSDFKNKFVTILNDLTVVDDIKWYNIDYDYYVNLCQKEIKTIENNK